MNSYTKHHIEKFYYKYKNREFCQDDVTLLLVLARDYTKKNSIFRELGDFLAHPDKKTRGLVIDSFKKVIDFFEENAEFVMDGGEIGIKRPVGLGALEEIQESLSEIFQMVECSAITKDKNDLSFRDFVFCLILLLSNFKLQINSKLVEMKANYSNSLSLTISYESTELERNYLTLNVLFLNAVWITNSGSHTENINEHIVRRFSNGLLGAIPYELDTSELPSDMRDIERGKVWPLPDL